MFYPKFRSAGQKSTATIDMPTKKLIIVVTVLLLVALMIWANVADGPAESIPGGSTGQSAGIEKGLPTEERIPTH